MRGRGARIGGADVEQQTRHQTRGRHGDPQARDQANRHHRHALANDHPCHVAAAAAQRQANADLLQVLLHVEAHHAAGRGEPFRLLYSVRTHADALYADELAGLVDDHFTLDWVYTREAPAGTRRRAGRVDAQTIVELTLPADTEPLIYVCGPTGFVESVASILVRRGHRPDRIRTERFGGL